MAELNRLASHLLYFAAIGVDLGATTVLPPLLSASARPS